MVTKLSATHISAMNARELRREFQMGHVTAEQLLDLLEERDRKIHRLEAEIRRIKERLAQYEPEIQEETGAASEDANTPTQHSLAAEEKRRQRQKRKRKRKKKSPGRRPTKLKVAAAHRFEDIFPPDASPADCRLVRERAIWRLENRRAVLVGYRIFCTPGGDEPSIPGVVPRCEYGIEIMVLLATMVYLYGLSLDQTCGLLHFFCELPLSKSQADCLLRQLARHWESEFENLVDLLVYSAVVYMDETGWKVGKKRCFLWTFMSDVHRVFLFGCRKDRATLDQILPPDRFQGIGVSDNAAVYHERFTRGQKCWAHLLRKAIRLVLLYPRKTTYKRFLDELLTLFHDAKHIAADRRLGDRARQQRVSELEDRLSRLCLPYYPSDPEKSPHHREFVNLVNELVELMIDEELFTFVLNPEVEPTNNGLERLHRPTAQYRNCGRTNKTAKGAHRRSVIVSVLESLRASLAAFTLTSLLAEVTQWMTDGISLFGRERQELAQEQKDVPQGAPPPIYDSG